MIIERGGLQEKTAKCAANKLSTILTLGEVEVSLTGIEELEQFVESCNFVKESPGNRFWLQLGWIRPRENLACSLTFVASGETGGDKINTGMTIDLKSINPNGSFFEKIFKNIKRIDFSSLGYKFKVAVDGGDSQSAILETDGGIHYSDPEMVIHLTNL